MKNRDSGRTVQMAPRGMPLKIRLDVMNRWRSSYNPLRGMSIARVVSMLEEGPRGNWPELQYLWSFVEQAHPDLFALVERRTSPMEELDYRIKIVPKDRRNKDFSQALADDQAGYLRAAYDRIDNMKAAIEHLEMAAFRKFSFLQPQIRDIGDPIQSLVDCNHLEVLDQWNFSRDGSWGDWYWNPEARNVNVATLGIDNKIDMSQVIVRQCRRAIDWTGLIIWMRANTCEKDWDAFCEIYGLSDPIIIMPPDVPADKQSEYEDAADDVATGGGGSLPNGSDVKWPTEMRGSQPFRPRLDYLTEKLALVGTGGILTMISAPGTGTLAGSAHMEAFKQIARAEAGRISEVFQQQFDKRLLAMRFPGRPVLAYFELAAREEKDVGKIIQNALTLSQAGFQRDVTELAEDTGYKLTVVPGGGPGNSGGALTPPAVNSPAVAARTLLNRTAAALLKNRDAKSVMEELINQTNLAKAVAVDLAPLRAEANRISDIEDEPTRKAEAIKFRANLRSVLEKATDGETARLLENAMTAGALNGMAERVEESRKVGGT